MVGLSEVDDFGDHGLADEDVDGFEVEVEDIVLDEMPHPVNNVDHQVQLAPQRDGLVPDADVEVQLLAGHHLHQHKIMQLGVPIDLVVLGQEVADAAPQLRHNILLVDDLLLPALELRPWSLHDHHPFNLLLVLHVVVVIGGADEGDMHAIGVDEAGAALADRPVVAQGFNYLHFGHVVDVVLDSLLGWVFDS